MYISTRGNDSLIPASLAIIKGIALDNGLYVPEKIPKIKDSLEFIASLSYKELAIYILKNYLDDFNLDELEEAINKAYDSKFVNNNITPMNKKGNLYFLELYHGQTLAFKDIALSLFPYLLKESLIKNSINKDIVILVATSGDTGKASLEAFKDIPGIKVIVFYPKSGVSSLQEIQMLTQEGNNTFVVSLDGNFDDAQRAIKDIFNDSKIKNDLFNSNILLSSANSINIGRFLPQIVYYFYSYLHLLRNNEIAINEKINFVVPTGNFGNILAGYYSKLMGLPINKLICASNENNVLTEFINTGIYNTNRNFKITSSPSMDILISSNLERLLYEISNRDSNLINNLMSKLYTDGIYKIPEFMKERLLCFYGGFASEEETKSAIKEVYTNFNYLIDPHTAVGYSVYNKYRKDTNDKSKTILLSTASPFKFPEVLTEALEINMNSHNCFDMINTISSLTKISIPTSLNNLSKKPIVQFNSCNKTEMKKIIYKILQVGDVYDKD